MNQSAKGCGVAPSRRLCAVLCSAIFIFVVQSQAQAQWFKTHHMRPTIASGKAQFLHRLPETQTLRINVVLALRDPNGLEKFLQDVYDPSSPSYRHFLTVPEFTARFGPTQEDYDMMVRYAQSNGLKVVGGSRDAMDIQLEGTVTSVEAAFHVSMGVYQHPTENRSFYAPDREPMVDLPITLWHISGLDNFSTPQPAFVRKSNAGLAVNSNATTGSGPSASFLGTDMRAAYYGPGSLTGSGQSIGLLEYYGYDIADLNTYYTNAGQTSLASKVTGVSTDGTSLSCVHSRRCDDTEQILDMTQALGMAPGINALYVYVGSTDTAILGAMTSGSQPPLQLSSSWTWTPADPSTDDPYFKKMAAQGQSFFQAAGDSGSWKTSTFPSEDPNVICVGGTDLTTSSAGGPWSGETVWVDGGGGISTDHLAIPTWQQLAGVITSTNKGSTTYRNGPDVSANSNFTFYVCADQTTCTANEYGGTSFATPMWAGYIALANQQAAASNNSPVGFLNPTIYPIGAAGGGNYTADFHDITSGSNGYAATTGYDLASGWGSPKGAALINALAGPAGPNFSISASPNSVTVAAGSSENSTISTTAQNGFDSPITLSAPTSLPAGVGVTFDTNPILSPGTGSSQVTFTVASTAAAGTYPITITGTDSTGEIINTTTVTLTVTAPTFTVSASPGSVSVVQGNAGTSLITVTFVNGFNSPVGLTATGQPSTVTVGFSPSSTISTSGGTSTLTMTVGSTTATGTYPITVTGSGAGPSGTITSTATVNLTVTAAASGFSISASPTSLSVTRGSSNTATITSTVSGSFSSAVSLAASGLPSGVTASFSPSSITGNGTSTLTLKASTRATLTTRTITIRGTSGRTSHTTTISLTVVR